MLRHQMQKRFGIFGWIVATKAAIFVKTGHDQIEPFEAVFREVEFTGADDIGLNPAQDADPLQVGGDKTERMEMISMRPAGKSGAMVGAADAAQTFGGGGAGYLGDGAESMSRGNGMGVQINLGKVRVGHIYFSLNSALNRQ
jgi:hypothetical protein